jgi:homoserine O-acetyltransferase
MRAAYALFVAQAVLAQTPPLQTANIGDFRLESGRTLKKCTIAYRTWGKLNEARDNAILFPSFFNGTSEDLADYVGPGRILDPSEHFIVAADALSNGFSTSPSNYTPARGRAFPQIAIGDMVESHYRLLVRDLKIDKLEAVVGISMGGMQVYEWLVRYPNFARRAVAIVATPRMGPEDIKLWIAQIPLNRRDGDPPPEEPAKPSPKKDRLGQILDILGMAADQGQKYREPFNPLRQFEALQRHDIGRKFGGSLDRAREAIQTPLLTVVALKDQALSPATPIEFAKAAGWPVVELDSPSGHAAFKSEAARIGEEISKFLRR